MHVHYRLVHAMYISCVQYHYIVTRTLHGGMKNEQMV